MKKIFFTVKSFIDNFNKSLKFKKILISILFISIAGEAQTINETGKPFLTNWSPKDYDAHSQNWAIIQDSRGIMYIGNSSGVLEFDGVSWRLLDYGEKSFIRSLAIDKSDRLFVGAKNEIGFFLPINEFIKNDNGKSKLERPFISLLKHIPTEYREFRDVQKTAVSSKGVFFLTDKFLFRYIPGKEKVEEGKIHVWKSKTGFCGMSIVDDRIYVVQHDIGLMEAKGDSLELIPGGEKMDYAIEFMIPFSKSDANKKILIGTVSYGLFWYNGTNCSPLEGDAASFLKELKISSGQPLADGTIAIATLNCGIIIFDPAGSGTILRVINKSSGLKDDIIHYLFIDRDGGLWAAHNSGIARLEEPSPFSFFDETHGLRGSPNTFLRYKNTLYIGTEIGLYYLNLTLKDFPGNAQYIGRNIVLPQPQFKPFAGIKNWVWDIIHVPGTDELLVGNGKNLYRIRGDRAELLMSYEDHIMTLHCSNKDPNRVYIGLRYNGLTTARYNPGNDTWLNEGKIPGIDEYIKNIEETEDGSLWLSAKYEKYLIRVKFMQSGTLTKQRDLSNPKIRRFGQAEGLPDLKTVYSIVINGQLFAYPGSAIYRFDNYHNIFTRDSTFFATPDTSVYIEITTEDKFGNIWFEFDRLLHVSKRKEDGSYKTETAPFRRIERQVFMSIYPEEDGIVWYGGSDALIRYDGGVTKNYEADVSALIRRVIAGKDSIIFDGLPIADGETKLPLPFTYNTLRFECAAPSYENLSANQFEYFLEGFDKGWSSWTKETKKDYTNLPEGDYKFRVRAKNIYQYVSREAVYSFTILPPWWRSWWAYGVYALLIGILIFIVDRVQRQRLIKKERERAEIRETTLRSQTIEAENKMLQSENKRKELELLKTKELEAAYTELKNTHENLKATQQQLVTQQNLASLGALTAGIAHEIKNPLNFVNNFSEISGELLDEMKAELQNDNIEEALSIANDLKQNLEKINQHGKRADSIVKGMLLHSRGTSGEKTLTDINYLLDQYVNLAYHGMRAQNKEFNIAIEKDYDESLEKINVVPQDISRVFLNIINNACYAAYDKKKKSSDDNFSPTLKVSTKNLKEKVEIRISDNGNGIPQNIIDKIFQPFFTTKPTGEGTGLGLSLSYDIIVKQHSGEIKFESGEGKYTEFIITLPKQK
ncbi:MAG: ATP-binding protein [Melioribacteraceae bacterium]